VQKSWAPVTLVTAICMMAPYICVARMELASHHSSDHHNFELNPFLENQWTDGYAPQRKQVLPQSAPTPAVTTAPPPTFTFILTLLSISSSGPWYHQSLFTRHLHF
jgi:hypothetical protein